MDSASTTPTTQVTPSSSSSGNLGPRPAEPKQRLTAAMNPLLRDLDWGHIPTAPEAAPSLSRAEVSEQLAATDGDDDWRRGPAIPGVPAQRPAPKQPTRVPGQRPNGYDAVVLGYGLTQANSAFAA